MKHRLEGWRRFDDYKAAMDFGMEIVDRPILGDLTITTRDNPSPDSETEILYYVILVFETEDPEAIYDEARTWGEYETDWLLEEVL